MARSLARPANLQLVSGRRAQRYLSLSGSVVLLSYAIYKQDPLFIVGQSTGMFYYLRNLVFPRRTRQESAATEIKS